MKITVDKKEKAIVYTFDAPKESPHLYLQKVRILTSRSKDFHGSMSTYMWELSFYCLGRTILWPVYSCVNLIGRGGDFVNISCRVWVNYLREEVGNVPIHSREYCRTHGLDTNELEVLWGSGHSYKQVRALGRLLQIRPSYTLNGAGRCVKKAFYHFVGLNDRADRSKLVSFADRSGYKGRATRTICLEYARRCAKHIKKYKHLAPITMVTSSPLFLRMAAKNTFSRNILIMPILPRFTLLGKEAYTKAGHKGAHTLKTLLRRPLVHYCLGWHFTLVLPLVI